MNRELEAIVEGFEAAGQRLQALASRLTSDTWTRRPAPERWSPLECVAHLNLTSSAFMPLLRDGLVRARGSKRPPPGRYRRDIRGWLIWYAVRVPGRFKARTTAPFVPAADRPPAEIVAEFLRLQADQIACVRESSGLAIDRVPIVSPFNPRLKYSMYSALMILPAHQHRHLWQAEEAAQGR